MQLIRLSLDATCINKCIYARCAYLPKWHPGFKYCAFRSQVLAYLLVLGPSATFSRIIRRLRATLIVVGSTASTKNRLSGEFNGVHLILLDHWEP